MTWCADIWPGAHHRSRSSPNQAQVVAALQAGDQPPADVARGPRDENPHTTPFLATLRAGV
jgi:hypothetical protein